MNGLDLSSCCCPFWREFYFFFDVGLDSPHDNTNPDYADRLASSSEIITRVGSSVLDNRDPNGSANGKFRVDLSAHFISELSKVNNGTYPTNGGLNMWVRIAEIKDVYSASDVYFRSDTNYGTTPIGFGAVNLNSFIGTFARNGTGQITADIGVGLNTVVPAPSLPGRQADVSAVMPGITPKDLQAENTDGAYSPSLIPGGDDSGSGNYRQDVSVGSNGYYYGMGIYPNTEPSNLESGDPFVWHAKFEVNKSGGTFGTASPLVSYDVAEEVGFSVTAYSYNNIIASGSALAKYISPENPPRGIGIRREIDDIFISRPPGAISDVRTYVVHTYAVVGDVNGLSLSGSDLGTHVVDEYTQLAHFAELDYKEAQVFNSGGINTGYNAYEVDRLDDFIGRIISGGSEMVWFTLDLSTSQGEGMPFKCYVDGTLFSHITDYDLGGKYDHEEYERAPTYTQKIANSKPRTRDSEPQSYKIAILTTSTNPNEAIAHQALEVDQTHHWYSGRLRDASILTKTNEILLLYQEAAIVERVFYTVTTSPGPDSRLFTNTKTGAAQWGNVLTTKETYVLRHRLEYYLDGSLVWMKRREDQTRPTPIPDDGTSHPIQPNGMTDVPAPTPGGFGEIPLTWEDALYWKGAGIFFRNDRYWYVNMMSFGSEQPVSTGGAFPTDNYSWMAVHTSGRMHYADRDYHEQKAIVESFYSAECASDSLIEEPIPDNAQTLKGLPWPPEVEQPPS